MNKLSNMSMSDLIAMRDRKRSQIVSKTGSLQSRKMNIANSLRMNDALAEKKKSLFKDGMAKSLNTMMYPYLLQTAKAETEVVAQNKSSTKVSVNGEASMIVTHYSRTIFKKVDIGAGVFQPVFIKPDDFGASGIVGPLKVLINDLSSNRTYTPNSISLTSFGHAQEPTELEESFYLDPNKSLQVIFDNQTDDIFYCSMMFFGFRLSIEDANHMFNQVTLSV